MSQTTAQQLAVGCDDPTIYCRACPGSGKTMVLVERIKRLIDEGVKPEKIAAVTYTVAAAKEVENRLPAIRLGHLGTLHSLMLKHINMWGKTKYATVTESESETLLDNIKATRKYTGTKKAIKDAMRAGSYADPGLVEAAAKVVSEYRRTLVEHGLLDFDMILKNGLPCMRLEENRGIYDHLLIDEAQDSATIDWQIYNAISAGNKFFVGDPYQSIFGFRGAIRDVELELDQIDPHRTTINLSHNFRCGQRICDVATALIPGAPVMVSAADDLGEFTAVKCLDTEAELSDVIGRIRTLAHEKQATAAILFRTNAQVDKWCETFDARGIPYVRAIRPSNDSELARAIAFIRAWGNPWNDMAVSMYCNMLGNIEVSDVTFDDAKTFWQPEWNAGELAEAMKSHSFSDEMSSFVGDLSEGIPASVSRSELHMHISPFASINPPADPGAPFIGTMHSAKGLEWDAVFLPEMIDGIMPSKRANEGEERRLAYVAYTRARSILAVSCPSTYQGQWAQSPEKCTPSRLVEW